MDKRVDDLVPDRVRRKLLDWIDASPVQQASTGLSQAVVLRCRSAIGDVCLRGWPIHVDASRIERLIAATKWAQEHDVNVVPGYLTPPHGRAYEFDGHRYWELTEWKPGVADYRQRPSRQRLVEALSRLGELHRVWRQWQCVHQPCPGIIRRISLLRKWSAEKRLQHVAHLSLSTRSDIVGEPIVALAVRTHRQFVRLAERLMPELTRLAAVSVDTHFALRDIHDEHVLYRNDHVTGIVDLGASAIDEPLVDVARLLGSMAPDLRDWAPALDAYQLASGQEVDVERLLLIDQVSCLLSALQWLEWLVIEPIDFRCPTAQVVSRWERLVSRLETAPWPSSQR